MAKTEDTVRIKLPRLKENNEDVYVAVNGKTWLLKRGIEIDVPRCVAEILQHKEDMEESLYRFVSSHNN